MDKMDTNAPGNAQDSLIEYPCDFPIKVMGASHADFAATMLEVVRRHDADIDASRLVSRDSAKGNYLSLTITVHATSRVQLDAIYTDLSRHPMVKMVL